MNIASRPADSIEDGPIHVLHVDDEPDFLTLAAAFLGEADDRLTLDSVESPHAALDRLEREHYDCILSDYDMPDMDGLRFLESVREHSPSIPFIFFTNTSITNLIDEALCNDATDILKKSTGSERYHLIAHRIVSAVSHYRAIDEYWAAPEAVDQLDEPHSAIDICRALTDLPPFSHCWIGMLSDNRTQLTPAVVTGDRAESKGDEPIDLTLDSGIQRLPESVDSSPVVTPNDPLEVAQAATGYTALIPLSRDGSVGGVLGVHAANADSPSQSERAILSSIGYYLNSSLDSRPGVHQEGDVEVIV